MTCQHQTREGRAGAFDCELGLYGGAPYLKNCQQCLAAGENTEEFARALQATHAASHPASRPRLSGCCDDARNPAAE